MKGAQTSNIAKKIVTKGWPKIMIIRSKQILRDIYFLFSRYYIFIM